MDTAIDAIRTFNRFYTRHVGAIDARFLDTDTNLPEARLLFEIASNEPVLAQKLQAALGMDRGYLSRLIARFEEREWVERDRSSDDARTRPIRLTPGGSAMFRQIDRRQHAVVAEDLGSLDAMERDDLAQALTRARLLLDPDYTDGFTLRPPHVGEVSMIAARQSRLYAAGYGWGRGLELIEAETTAAYLRDMNPDKDACWVADLAGVMAGAVFVTGSGDGTARLRLLHVEPFARRRGIGDALVGECIAFARRKGYRELRLWTHSVLDGARRIYARHGFQLVATEPHDLFGKTEQGETWSLDL